jgi:hypothetical protein
MPIHLLGVDHALRVVSEPQILIASCMILLSSGRHLAFHMWDDIGCAGLSHEVRAAEEVTFIIRSFNSVTN